MGVASSETTKEQKEQENKTCLPSLISHLTAVFKESVFSGGQAGTWEEAKRMLTATYLKTKCEVTVLEIDWEQWEWRAAQAGSESFQCLGLAPRRSMWGKHKAELTLLKTQKGHRAWNFFFFFLSKIKWVQTVLARIREKKLLTWGSSKIHYLGVLQRRKLNNRLEKLVYWVSSA